MQRRPEVSLRAPGVTTLEQVQRGSTAPCRLFWHRGYGSVLAEAALTVAGVPFEKVEVDMDGPRSELRAHNPLGQLPTLLLPDGEVLTESLAIVLWLSELAPAAELAPPPGHPLRPRFLRWLTFLVAAVYPTFTFGDDPARFCDRPDSLRERVLAHRQALWRQVEQAASAPWFLGETWSALDLYVCAMTQWGPGPAWFAEHAPRLTAIARACRGRPELAPVWQANFGAA